MKRDLAALSNSEFDLVIIGGGVYGLATAWDAAMRGLKVALIERGDFGHATSSASLKLVHGGLRYLQHLDFVRMRISILERRRMQYMAPHLVSPLEFVIPCYGHAIRGPEFMWCGLTLNDILSFDRNSGLDPQKRIPGGRIISAAECLNRVPGISKDGLTGGAVFYDAQMYNSERLSLSFGLSAAAESATIANYCEATGFVIRNSEIKAVKVVDQLSGRNFEIRGTLFVNMTGPWSDITVQWLKTAPPDRKVLRSKGVQLITRSIGKATAFAIESRQKDSTALIARGGRNYFVTPWRGLSFIGTTDALFEDDPDRFAITKADVEDFRNEINDIFPAAELKPEDVKFWVGGLRPVGDADTDPRVAKASHKYTIFDHRSDGSADNLISVIGVKYTISRQIAQQTVNVVFDRLGIPCPRCRTGDSRLWGGEIDNVAAFQKECLEKVPDPVVAEHLGRNYGTKVAAVLDVARKDSSFAGKIAGSSEALRAEVVYAVREEMAIKLTDVILRRTDLGSAGHPGRPALEDCAAIMAKECGWSNQRKAQELAEAEAVYLLK